MEMLGLAHSHLHQPHHLMDGLVEMHQWRTSTGGDGSYIRLVNAGSSQGGPNSYMYQAITTVPGIRYKISLTQYHHATISVYYKVGTSINGGELVSSTWVSSSSNTPRGRVEIIHLQQLEPRLILL